VEGLCSSRHHLEQHTLSSLFSSSALFFEVTRRRLFNGDQMSLHRLWYLEASRVNHYSGLQTRKLVYFQPQLTDSRCTGLSYCTSKLVESSDGDLVTSMAPRVPSPCVSLSHIHTSYTDSYIRWGRLAAAKVLDTGKETYEHVSAEHGGFYDPGYGDD